MREGASTTAVRLAYSCEMKTIGWVACALVFVSTGALAAGAPTPQAPTAFEQGVALQGKQQFGAALAAFQRAYAAQPTAMSALHIGQCEAALGHLTIAQADFQALAGATIPPNAPPEARAAQTQARAELANLMNQPTVHVTLYPPVRDATVTLDGSPYDMSGAGETRRVAAGTHVIVVATDGRYPVEKFVTVSEAQHTNVDVVLLDASENTETTGNPALLGVGVTLTILAGVGFGIGLSLLALNVNRGEAAVPAAIMLASFLGLGAGIPMIVVGAHQTPVSRVSAVPPFPTPHTLALNWNF